MQEKRSGPLGAQTGCEFLGLDSRQGGTLPLSPPQMGSSGGCSQGPLYRGRWSPALPSMEGTNIHENIFPLATLFKIHKVLITGVATLCGEPVHCQACHIDCSYCLGKPCGGHTAPIKQKRTQALRKMQTDLNQLHLAPPPIPGGPLGASQPGCSAGSTL